MVVGIQVLIVLLIVHSIKDKMFHIKKPIIIIHHVLLLLTKLNLLVIQKFIYLILELMLMVII
jgi:hypothetical protein